MCRRGRRDRTSVTVAPHRPSCLDSIHDFGRSHAPHDAAIVLARPRFRGPALWWSSWLSPRQIPQLEGRVRATHPEDISLESAAKASEVRSTPCFDSAVCQSRCNAPLKASAAARENALNFLSPEAKIFEGTNWGHKSRKVAILSHRRSWTTRLLPVDAQCPFPVGHDQQRHVAELARGLDHHPGRQRPDHLLVQGMPRQRDETKSSL